jgi:putative transposase
MSSVVNREFVLCSEEKEEFVRLMRLYEKFYEVRKVTYCIMSNHFHVNVEVGRKLRILLPLSSTPRLRLSR